MHLFKVVFAALLFLGIGVMLVTVWTAKPDPPNRERDN
jgi:hypothetical protein